MSLSPGARLSSGRRNIRIADLDSPALPMSSCARERIGVQKAKLIAGDAAKSDRFGHSVAMSGNTIIVGAPLHDTPAGKDAGTAYIFISDGDSWKQQAKLMPAKAEPANQLGFRVATTGNIAIVGAPARKEGARASGAAYLLCACRKGLGGERKGCAQRWRERPQVRFLNRHERQLRCHIVPQCGE